MDEANKYWNALRSSRAATYNRGSLYDRDVPVGFISTGGTMATILSVVEPKDETPVINFSPSKRGRVCNNNLCLFCATAEGAEK